MRAPCRTIWVSSMLQGNWSAITTCLLHRLEHYDNHHEWSRLWIENGGSQLIRECRDPRRVGSRTMLLRVAQSSADEIQDDDIFFHDDFKKDLAALEACRRDSNPQPSDPLRSRVVTFLAENYTSKEAMCPACLFETPHDLTVCLDFRRTPVSYGDIGPRQKMNNNFNEMMADPMTSQEMTVNNRMRTSTRSMSSSEKQKQRPDNNRLSMMAMRST